MLEIFEVKGLKLGRADSPGLLLKLKILLILKEAKSKEAFLGEEDDCDRKIFIFPMKAVGSSFPRAIEISVANFKLTLLKTYLKNSSESYNMIFTFHRSLAIKGSCLSNLPHKNLPIFFQHTICMLAVLFELGLPIDQDFVTYWFFCSHVNLFSIFFSIATSDIDRNK